MDIKKLLHDIDNLPLGHYDRDQAKALIAKEYVLCKAIKLPERILTEREPARFTGYLVRHFGLPKIRRIVLESKEASRLAGLYFNREIHFPGKTIWLGTLLHELAHHVKAYGGFDGPSHGEGFIEALELVKDLWEEYQWMKSSPSI